MRYTEAKQQGLKFYFTGKPCKRGHIANRYTSTSDCTLCVELRGKMWLTTRPAGYRKKICAAWYIRNSKRQIAKAKLWGNLNPEAIARYKKRSYQRNPEPWRTASRNWHARRRGNGGQHTVEHIVALIFAQDNQCAACSKGLEQGYHVDHIMPLVLGGSNGPANLQLLCARCNQTKSGRHPTEWLQMMRAGAEA